MKSLFSHEGLGLDSSSVATTIFVEMGVHEDAAATYYDSISLLYLFSLLCKFGLVYKNGFFFLSYGLFVVTIFSGSFGTCIGIKYRLKKKNHVKRYDGAYFCFLPFYADGK